ncbi:unnamed protein product [Ixodes hexagonus]
MVITSKTSPDFAWIGDFTIRDRRSKHKCYSKFRLSGTEYAVGDCVLIRDDDSMDPEELRNCFVGRIKSAFDTGDLSKDHRFVTVQWYLRVTELPPTQQARLGQCDYFREVLQDERSAWADTVDIDTIFGKCSVVTFAADILPEFVFELTDPWGNPLFICRWKYTGRSVVPAIDAATPPSAGRKRPFRAKTSSSKFAEFEMTMSAKSTGKRKSARNLFGDPDEQTTLSRVACELQGADDALASPHKLQLSPSKVLLVTPLKVKRENETWNCARQLTPRASQRCAGTPVDRNGGIFEDDPFVTPTRTRRAVAKRCQTEPGARTADDGTPLREPPRFSRSGRKLKSIQRSLGFCTDESDDEVFTRWVGPGSFHLSVRLFSVLIWFREAETHNARHCNESGSVHDYLSLHVGECGEEWDGGRSGTVDIFLQLAVPKGWRFARLMVPRLVAAQVQPARANMIHCTASESIFENIRSMIQAPILAVNFLRQCSQKYGSTCPERRLKLYTCTSPLVKNATETYCSEKSTRRISVSRRKLDMGQEPRRPQLATGPDCETSDDDDVFEAVETSSSTSDDGDFEDTEKKASRNSTHKKRSHRKPSTRTTPASSRKSTATLTPSLPKRERAVSVLQTPLDIAKSRLHVSAVPECLPCREQEFADIYSFVDGKLQDGTGGCMYISGVPGTGKTATVHDVMRVLRQSVESSCLPPFTFVEVNGMKLTTPFQCYSHILKALTGETATAEHAAELLGRRFERPGPKREPVVLLVDELDLLWTRKQQVMYNLFEWPARPQSRLIVLTIANTMDLPERLMSNRVASRLGLTRMTFHPYNYKQLQEIVLSRMQDLEAFDPDAVQLVARKASTSTCNGSVAAVSGDARRALDICRRAAEMAESSFEGSPKKKSRHIVGMAHVDQAIQEMFSSPKIVAMRNLAQQEQLFMRAVVAEFERTGVEEGTFSSIYQQHISLCRLEGAKPPTLSEASAICARLASCRLLLAELGCNDLYYKIQLNVNTDDVNYALKNA